MILNKATQTSPLPPLPPADLELIAQQTGALWTEASNATLFITGGTGFFGIWLLESLCFINRALGLNLKATVLSRDPEAFLRHLPHLRTCRELSFLSGDVRNFTLPAKHYDLVIHGATAASEKLSLEAPMEMYSTICEGTQHVLNSVVKAGCQRFLFISSGAVYGEQPPDMPTIPEDYIGGPNPLSPGSVYGEAKRMAENLCAIYARTHKLNYSVARCFAFVGPHLPLNTHFAIGNFIRDAMQGGPIRINGDGTPCRSYLYTTDLAVWLWTILLQGRPALAYNVGSCTRISIAELAQVVSAATGGGSAILTAQPAQPNAHARHYIPNTERAKTELKLNQYVPIEIALKKTIDWLQLANRT